MKLIPIYKQSLGGKYPLPNSIWVEYIYDHICSVYLFGHNERTIEMMEQILFLTQVDALRFDSKDFLGGIVYYGDNEFRIESISDMLRVREVDEYEFTTSVNVYLSSEYFKRNKERAEKYYSLNELELQEKVRAVIECGGLDPKWFIMEKYVNKKYRGIARIYARNGNHFFQMIARRFLLGGIRMLWYMSVFTFLLVLITGMPSRETALPFFVIAIFLTPFTLIYRAWTNKWRREPTPFEVEHNYVDD